MTTLKKIETVVTQDDAILSAAAVVFDAVATGKVLKTAIGNRATNLGRVFLAERQSSDAVFALVSRPADLRTMATSKVKADNYKLSTDKGALEFLIDRLGLKIELRQMRRALATGAGRAWIMANVIDDATGRKCAADSKLLPESWAAGDALTAKIDTPNELKNGTWKPRAHKATVAAQIVKHVIKADPGIAKEMTKRAKAYPENIAKGMSQLDAATAAAKGKPVDKTPEQAEKECKATVKAVLAKLARTANTTKNPKATLAAYVVTMRALLGSEKQADALTDAKEAAALKAK